MTLCRISRLPSFFLVACLLLVRSFAAEVPGVDASVLETRRGKAMRQDQDYMRTLCGIYRQRPFGVALPKADFAEARMWCEMAANAGNNASEFQLGRLYEEGGPGLAMDVPTTLKYFARAEEATFRPVSERLRELSADAGLPRESDSLEELYAADRRAGRPLGKLYISLDRMNDTYYQQQPQCQLEILLGNPGKLNLKGTFELEVFDRGGRKIEETGPYLHIDQSSSSRIYSATCSSLAVVRLMVPNDASYMRLIESDIRSNADLRFASSIPGLLLRPGPFPWAEKTTLHIRWLQEQPLRNQEAQQEKERGLVCRYQLCYFTAFVCQDRSKANRQIELVLQLLNAYARTGLRMMHMLSSPEFAEYCSLSSVRVTDLRLLREKARIVQSTLEKDFIFFPLGSSVAAGVVGYRP